MGPPNLYRPAWVAIQISIPNKGSHKTAFVSNPTDFPLAWITITFSSTVSEFFHRSSFKDLQGWVQLGISTSIMAPKSRVAINLFCP